MFAVARILLISSQHSQIYLYVENILTSEGQFVIGKENFRRLQLIHLIINGECR